MLLSYNDLQEYTKRKRAADVVRWLNDRRVRWWTDGEGKPCTTLTQLDKALEQREDEFTFDG